MAKKGTLTSAVETAVKAAEKALAPSPLAKRMVAAATSQAIAAAEQRAREAIAPIDKAVQEATKPRFEQKKLRRKSARKTSVGGRRKSAARKSSASRKTSKSLARTRSRVRRKTSNTKSRGARRAKSKRP